MIYKLDRKRPEGWAGSFLCVFVLGFFSYFLTLAFKSLLSIGLVMLGC